VRGAAGRAEGERAGGRGEQGWDGSSSGHGRGSALRRARQPGPGAGAPAV
jgi:hypothetical protein